MNPIQLLKSVRMNSKKWHIKSNKVGVMGFSAGGHLAATLAVHHDDVFIENPSKVRLRPDFTMLIYPLISFADKLVHQESMDNLLGKEVSKTKIDYYSIEKQVNRSTPPSFITYALDDDIVPPENGLLFYEALCANKVRVRLKTYPKGGHGFLIEPSFTTWFGECTVWMRKNRLL
ncbi:MAG: alpha/beta hydrolase [Pedobacter sp.]|nr:MAG: alpha/beta hydrolase [Pedobacter sp.]